VAAKPEQRAAATPGRREEETRESGRRWGRRSALRSGRQLALRLGQRSRQGEEPASSGTRQLHVLGISDPASTACWYKPWQQSLALDDFDPQRSSSSGKQVWPVLTTLQSYLSGHRSREHDRWQRNQNKGRRRRLDEGRRGGGGGGSGGGGRRRGRGGGRRRGRGGGRRRGRGGGRRRGRGGGRRRGWGCSHARGRSLWAVAHVSCTY